MVSSGVVRRTGRVNGRGTAGQPAAGGSGQQRQHRENAVGTTQATGEIQATIRLDYPISSQKLQEIGAKLTLFQGKEAIATGDLSQDSTLTFSESTTASGGVSQRTTDQTVNYIDVNIRGLSAQEDENTYHLKFEAEGFKTYESDELTLSQYSKGIVLGTGDATFTQGDLNGDNAINTSDVDIVKSKLSTNDSKTDLNGDGKVDIYDLAVVTMASAATGEAQLFNTTVITAKVVDTASVAQAITGSAKVEIQQGDVSSLFTDDG